MMRHALSAMSALVLLALPAGAQEDASRADGGGIVRISEFSGLPVPRFEALRYSEVNGRAGPSKDYPVEWKYRRAGLPVLIVKETYDWRQVRDPDGALVWVHADQLMRRASALVRGSEEVTVRRKPDIEAGPVVRLQAGVIVTLGDCEAGWCRVEAGGRRGWVERLYLWGSTVEEERF